MLKNFLGSSSSGSVDGIYFVNCQLSKCGSSRDGGDNLGARHDAACAKKCPMSTPKANGTIGRFKETCQTSSLIVNPCIVPPDFDSFTIQNTS